jgi:hypothetical protein
LVVPERRLDRLRVDTEDVHTHGNSDAWCSLAMN